MINEKRSLACKNRPRHACQYCGRMIGHGNLLKHEKKCYEENFCKRDLLQEESRYIKYYNTIIQNRINNPIIESYKERHHIKPRCMGGSNDSSNLVNLTAREHYICHLLLCKIYDKNLALLSAFLRMSNDVNKQHISSRHYEEMKQQYINIKSEKMSESNHMAGRIWVNNGVINKSINKEDLSRFLEMGFQKGRLIDLTTLKLFKKGDQVAHVYKGNVTHLIDIKSLFKYLDEGWKIGKCEAKDAKYKMLKDGYTINVQYASIKIWERRGWILSNEVKRRNKQLKKDKKPNIRKMGQIKLINDGNKQLFVLVQDLDAYLTSGWKLGGIKGLKSGIAKSFRTQEHRLKLEKLNKERAKRLRSPLSSAG